MKKFVMFLLFLLIVPTKAFGVLGEWCGTPDTSSGMAGLAQIETVKVLAIWGCGSGTDSIIPYYHRTIFNIDSIFSIPKYYKDNSSSKHILSVDVYGKNGLNDTICFVSSIPHENVTCYGSSGGHYGDSIFKKADPVINYANYDKDNDGFVDYVFLMTKAPYASGTARNFTSEYHSSDTNAYGDTVIVELYRGICVAPRPDSFQLQSAIRIACHEYGHLLDFDDIFDNGYCSHQGPYELMGYHSPQNRYPPPFTPYERINKGWITPINVTQSIIDKEVKNYLKDNEVYQLRAKQSRDEFFWVTHYYGKFDPDASLWEQGFLGRGLLVWQYDTAGVANCNGVNRHRRHDLELAQGLYEYNTSGAPWQVGNPNDSAGLDSLDIRIEYPYLESQNLESYTSPNMYWNSNTKTNFDILSNPSSDGYLKGMNENDTQYFQNLPSYVGVSNIRGNGATVPMTVDFLINDRVGRIKTNDTNTTWNAGTYTINGDLTIDSNVTLVIKPGAIVKFTHFRDRMASGVDVKKPEIIVKGTLIAKGTADSLIKFVPFRSSPSDTDWYGIRVLPGGSAKLKYAQIKHAYIGASYENSASDTVANCLFDSNFVYGIKAFNNNLVLRSSSIKNMPNGYGIYSLNYGPKVENNYFENTKYGVYSAGASVITGNKFAGSSNAQIAILCETGGAETVSSDTVTGSFTDTYIETYKSHAVISNCVLNGSAPTGVKEVLAALSGTPAKVRTSNIWGYTSKGIYAGGGKIDVGNEGDADPGYNNIHTSASGTKSVYDATSTTIMAESNWWGQSPPPSSLFQGPVDRTPYLTDSTEAGPTGKLLPFQQPVADNIPQTFAVAQNYPNPFNPTTVIEYSIPVASKVSIKVYNILGQQVKKLFEGEKLAGTYTVEWAGTNESGKEVSSGIYLYMVEAGEFKETKKMTLIR